ncbi:hypothetical protein [Caulobacter sp. RHG1]|uniref:hypothetical protein n=1 Tax=Caulobacter sp. (strain RHG1) TaxID=2545762 RepID=UPI0015533A63|nr:hypothetical protein [Caulobacter sp. RHG1]
MDEETRELARNSKEFARETLGSLADYGAHLHVLESFLVSTAQELEKSSPGAAARIIDNARQLNARSDRLFEAVNQHWDRLSATIAAR